MNPYEVLNITPTAVSVDIVRATTLALREKKYSARDVAEARKQLMDPATRLILDFVHSVDLTPLMTIFDRTAGEPLLLRSAELERLDIFDSHI